MRIIKLLGASALAVGATLSTAHAGVVTFFNDQAAFDAASAGTIFDAINFDSMATGTNLAGSTVSGVTFNSPDGNTLEVVAAADTFTPGGSAANSLPATSGLNVLSPGGVELVPGSNIAERDSLELVFSTAVSAISLDILFQSYDFAPFASVRAYDASGTRIYFENVPGSSLGAGAPGGSVFFGIVSDDFSTNIARLVITDSDGNASNPDSNLGYDSLKFTAIDSNAVPIPAAAFMFIPALAGMFMSRRKKQG